MRLILLFICVIGPSAWAANDLLVWGQARRYGFAFAGKPETIRDQCMAWMKARQIERLSDLIVRGEKVVLQPSSQASDACLAILEKGADLGSPQKHRIASGDVRRFAYSFTGQPSVVLPRCLLFLRQADISSTYEITLEGKRIPFPSPLRHDEICGEIIFRGPILEDPFKQYYASGSVEQNGFTFVGFREVFQSQCLSFLSQHRITRVTRYKRDEESLTFPYAVAEPVFCDEVFSKATLVADTQARFSATGRIRNEHFWFVGPTSSFLSSCDNWAKLKRINTVMEVVVEGKSVIFKERVVGSGVCGTIFKNAKSTEVESDIKYSTGRVGSVGFAFGGADEVFARRCTTYLIRRKPMAVSAYEVEGEARVLPDSLAQGSLCEDIWKNAKKVPPPFQVYSVNGTLRGEQYWFRGRHEEVLNQCADFSEKLSLGYVTFFKASGKDVYLKGSFLGPEVCGELFKYAVIAEEASKIFVGGAVDKTGFSFLAPKEVMELDCRNHLQTNGIAVARKIRIFDQEYNLDPPITGAAEICRALIGMGAEVAKIPAIKAGGTVAGIAFSFEGPADEVNMSCRAFAKEKALGDITKFTLNAKELVAPTIWNREELCSVILRTSLNN